ncbi:MAG: hypothetical protein Edafosvirus41_7 [Edafosvirus sp.]|uniref:Uncharacterized protein n=1 Tax=Edafosvirus sp. TaxID=2487765 RepID=A0A3G4ZXY6_9VIRU|nr:MAG: hypothetical protein Edafosvirus41_7 [Edafosvirus sp.]
MDNNLPENKNINDTNKINNDMEGTDISKLNDKISNSQENVRILIDNSDEIIESDSNEHNNHRVYQPEEIKKEIQLRDQQEEIQLENQQVENQLEKNQENQQEEIHQEENQQEENHPENQQEENEVENQLENQQEENQQEENQQEENQQEDNRKTNNKFINRIPIINDTKIQMNKIEIKEMKKYNKPGREFIVQRKGDKIFVSIKKLDR